MRLFLSLIFTSLFACDNNIALSAASTQRVYMNSNAEINKHVALSMKLLDRLKANEKVQDVLQEIANINLDALIASLNTKEKKLAFWVNIYNGIIQHELTRSPELFDDKENFYKGQRTKIAGILMSYDNIEHGILRNSRVKLSLGYIKRWFVKDWEKQLRNTDIDGRIHFALNCGAKSCPPVAVLNDLEINKQLDDICKLYLKDHIQVEDDQVTTSPLFSWFRGDFGGKSGIIKFLQNYDLVPAGKYKLSYEKYDWTLETGNYVEL